MPKIYGDCQFVFRKHDLCNVCRLEGLHWMGAKVARVILCFSTGTVLVLHNVTVTGNA